MKKFLVLFVVVLGLGYWVMTLMKEEEKPISTIVEADRDFAIKDIDSVNKIYLFKRNGKKTKLEKIDKDNWIYNDTFEARMIMVNQLLTVMKRIEVYFKVNDAAMENVINHMSSNNIKVEAYDKSNNLIKCYYVGHSTLDTEGSFMLIDGAEFPYAVHDPKMVGILGPVYGVSGNAWIDRKIYHYNPEAIQKVKIEYSFNKENSFELSRKDNGFVLSKLDKEPDPNVTIESNIVIENYLKAFKMKIAEKSVFSKKNSPFIKSVKPFCTITVWDKDGKEGKTIFYPTEAEMIAEKSDTYIQKYYILREDGYMFKGQHNIMKKLFVSHDFFVK